MCEVFVDEKPEHAKVVLQEIFVYEVADRGAQPSERGERSAPATPGLCGPGMLSQWPAVKNMSYKSSKKLRVISPVAAAVTGSMGFLPDISVLELLNNE